jgi:nicotinate-nucleotide adenylyltransferase
MEPVPAPLPRPLVRLGLFGGSFDPVHEGHLGIAREAVRVAGLEELWFLPAAQPPHKPGRRLAPPEDRVAMLELALAEEPRMRVRCDELERGGTSWTLDTVRALAGEAEELWLLIGSDNLAGLPGWRGVEEILERAQPLVALRDAAAVRELEDAAARIGGAAGARLRGALMALEPLPGASTRIREALARGEAPDDLCPAVAEFVRRRGLYAPTTAG